MRVTIRDGKCFDVGGEETILGAALAAGLVFEHGCKAGRCGACKAQVQVGVTRPLMDEIGLSLAEKEAGCILTCVRAAVSDVQLDVEDVGDVRLYPPKTLPCRIYSLERLCADVMRVVLRLPPSQQLDYHPGQYVEVIGRNGLRRSYSIANAATGEKVIELHVRYISNGEMSRYWFHEAQVGDLLRLNGPLGTFFLRDIAGVDLIFLATGTGVAPIKSMLEGLVAEEAKSLPRSIKFFWGGRHPQDLYWNVADLGLELQYIPVLSRADASWSGARGYVQQQVLSITDHLEQVVVYACGSLVMIDGARAELVAAGLNPRRFYSDAFVSSSQPVKERI